MGWSRGLSSPGRGRFIALRGRWPRRWITSGPMFRRRRRSERMRRRRTRRRSDRLYLVEQTFLSASGVGTPTADLQLNEYIELRQTRISAPLKTALKLDYVAGCAGGATRRSAVE